MTNKNYFFSEEQESLSKEFFRDCPSEKIALENMLEKFGYGYEYNKVKVMSKEVYSISIFMGTNFLGTFFKKEIFEPFGTRGGIYLLLENFGYAMKEAKNGKV